jgi:DNA replication and repair protein RecF
VIVTRLTLSHFRSHKRAELYLDNRPVALFGANGAGKTNILEAVSLLSPGRGLRRATAQQMARLPESLGWKIGAEILRDGLQHDIVLRAEAGANRTVTLDGKTVPQSALGDTVRMLWLVPSMDRLWIEGAEGRRRFLDRMTLSFFPAHAEASLTYDKAMRERNRLLKDQVRDPHWYAALEAQMASAATQIMDHRHACLAALTMAMGDAATAFPRAEVTLLDEGSAGLADVWANTRGADLRAGRTLMGPHRSDFSAVYAEKSMPAAQCSTGEQKALLISLILANARALTAQIGAPPLVLLDEVAAHLDANRRAALYDEICDLGAQAWMTGTGVELFDSLGGRVQMFEIHAEDGIHPVKD